MNTKQDKKYFTYLCIILCFIVGGLFNIVTGLYDSVEGMPLEKLSFALNCLVNRTFEIRLYTSRNALLSILWGFFFVFAFWMYFYFSEDVYRRGEEYGSARWGDSKDRLKIMIRKDISVNNIILTATEKLSLNGFFTRKNNNVCVMGEPGKGKTRFFVKPNLYQANTSFVCIDPKGTLFHECGKYLQSKGYTLRVFNTVNFAESMHYNPFHYIKREEDILRFVTTLINNTTNPEKKGGDDYWEKAETLLYNALIGYIWKYVNEEEQNLETLNYMLDCIEVHEENEAMVNGIDVLFEELESLVGEDFCVLQYKKFRIAAGKTLKSILSSTGGRLGPFCITRVREITRRDDLFLEDIGRTKKDKVCLFIVKDDSDSTYDFLVSILQSQVIQVTKNTADSMRGKLKHALQMFCDEFGTTGKIVDVERAINSVRSRLISINPIIQNLAQIDTLYGEKARKTIIGGCSTLLFLGSNEPDMLEYISKLLGKQTITIQNYTDSKGTHGSHSVNTQKIARDLMTPDEVGLISDEECILKISGVRPFLSRKFDLKMHPNYKETYDYAEEISDEQLMNERYLEFDIEALMDASIKTHKKIWNITG